MSKPRVRMQPTRAVVADTQAVKMLNPDAWRAGLTTAQRGYGGKWQRYRLKFLERNPLCVLCQEAGRVTAANVVDHIVDHRGDSKLFWATDNHRPLCASCHNRKTSEGGIGSERRG